MFNSISNSNLNRFYSNELIGFKKKHVNSAKSKLNNSNIFFNRQPMNWMADWSLPFLPLIDQAIGSQIRDIDNNTFDDFCLGDTASMFGHSPSAVSNEIIRQSKKGFAYMLPSKQAVNAGINLTRVFGKFQWQIANTASDANRFAIRVVRAVTRKSKILVFNGCYHGAVDDTLVELKRNKTVNAQGLTGQVYDLSKGTVVAEFNNLKQVEMLFKKHSIAAVLTEPVLTNCCMVLPEKKFLEKLIRLTHKYKAFFILDETHTISSGYGGYGRQNNLKPDLIVIGKCIASGITTAVWGMNDRFSKLYQNYLKSKFDGRSGIGTTLSANPIQFASLNATLTKVITRLNYKKMEQGAKKLEMGLNKIIQKHELNWHVVRVGARVEFICSPGPLKNGTEALKAHQPKLERAVHLGLMNRGSLIAPFHNMMLISPVTYDKQINKLVKNFDDVLQKLI